MKIVVLSGGVGGARFVKGVVEVAEPADVTVIGNVGDDLEVLGMYVSPDLDSILYALAGLNDEQRGWGRAGETWNALDLIADSTGFHTDDQTAYDVVYRGFLLSYQQEIVPPGDYLIIDVALRLGALVENAQVSADFATGEFAVTSPMVDLAIVYPAIGQAVSD